MANWRNFLWGLYFLLFALGLTSCDTNTTRVCDCEGDEARFKNYRGIVARDRTDQFVIVSDRLGYILPCEGLDSSMKIDGQKVVFSGSYIPGCIQDNPSYGVKVYNIQVASIAPSDTIFSGQPIKIEIIKSEDHGYPQGFGYSLKYKNFNILQPILPGVGGFIPFSSESDAFKIALRVAYRLNTVNDFPSTPYSDLYYLRIVQ